MFKLLGVILLLNFLDVISGHGMMMDPVGRGSRWRVDGSDPKNYNDMENFCGGAGVQWNQNGGRCGFCGDSFSAPQPRDHELGGTFGQGVIVKTYSEGAAISVTARLTANHKGYFVFRICNLDNGPESDACFEHNHVMTEGGEVYTLPSYDSKDFVITLYLPRDLKCNHCVLQWTYITANSWGTCNDGSQAAGCGPQENFRTCSDITIR